MWCLFCEQVCRQVFVLSAMAGFEPAIYCVFVLPVKLHSEILYYLAIFLDKKPTRKVTDIVCKHFLLSVSIQSCWLKFLLTFLLA